MILSYSLPRAILYTCRAYTWHCTVYKTPPVWSDYKGC